VDRGLAGRRVWLNFGGKGGPDFFKIILRFFRLADDSISSDAQPRMHPAAEGFNDLHRPDIANPRQEIDVPRFQQNSAAPA